MSKNKINEEKVFSNIIKRTEQFESKCLEIKKLLKELIIIEFDAENEMCLLNSNNESFDDEYSKLHKRKLLALTLYSFLSYPMLNIEIFEDISDVELAEEFLIDLEDDIIEILGKNIYNKATKCVKILKTL